MWLKSLAVVVPAAIGVGVYFYNKWNAERELRKVRQALVDTVNSVEDVDDPLELVQVTIETKQLKRKLRYHGISAIIRAVQFAEMKVGLLKDNAANRMVVDKIIRDYMIAPKGVGLGMRVAHAVRDYRVAVSMYFKPRAQAVILDAVDKLEVDELKEAKKILGLDGSH